MNFCDFSPNFRYFVLVLTLTSVASANNSSDTSFCTSEICQQSGEEIVSIIDQTVDACSDFFQHACGGWMAKYPLQNSARSSDQFTLVDRKVENGLRDLLDTEDANDDEAIRKAKDFYNTCMDLATIDRKGLQPMMKILDDNGHWPLTVPTNQWNPENPTWVQIHEGFTKVTGFPGLFEITVEIEETNSKAHVVTLKPVETPKERERLLALENLDSSNTKDKRSSAYRNYVMNTALNFTHSKNAGVTKAEVEADVAAMLEFEEKLMKASRASADSDFDNGTNYRITTIKEVQDIWDSAVNNDSQYKVDWLQIIKTRFESSSIVIDENEKIALQPGVYLERLGALLSKTPTRTIVNYIHWYAIERLLTYGDKVMRRLEMHYLAEKEGITEPLVRWRTCSKDHKMPHAISFMYVKKHFTEKSRKSVLEVIDYLRVTSKENIDNASWMKENERRLAKEKIDAMVNRIGYPDWYDEPGKVDEYYNELTVGSDYFENVLAARRHEIKKNLLKLRNPANQANADWPLYAVQVNAGYNDVTNSLNFPAAYLQIPTFNYQNPAALKFGTIGATIGHEISHGFDNNGRLSDKDGNRHQWWSNATIDNYNKKANCFIEQYNKYEITKNSTTKKPIYVDGSYTLDENLADNAGFSVGFKALQRYKSLHPNENVEISELKDFSDEKLYFYALANLFCDVLQPEFLELTYPTVWYSPNKVRINGALSNMEEFAKTFSCPRGSKMNPQKKCVLWT